MVKGSLFPHWVLPLYPHNTVILGHVSARQFKVSVSHNIRLPSRKGKPVLTMHLIFHLISTNTLRDAKGKVWLVSCWQIQTHQCKSHPRWGPGYFPSWRLLFLAGWLIKHVPALRCLWFWGMADLPSRVRVSCDSLHLGIVALSEWGDRATLSFAWE